MKYTKLGWQQFGFSKKWQQQQKIVPEKKNEKARKKPVDIEEAYYQDSFSLRNSPMTLGIVVGYGWGFYGIYHQNPYRGLFSHWELIFLCSISSVGSWLIHTIQVRGYGKKAISFGSLNFMAFSLKVV